MKRALFDWTYVTLVCLGSACIGIEHEDIGAGGDETGGTSLSGTGDEGEGEGDGDGDGESGWDEGTGSSDGSFDVSNGDGDGDGDGDAGPMPRLFVADGTVRVWERADLADDAPPHATLPTATALALAIGDDRLLVASADAQTPLSIFADAPTIDDGGQPADGVDADGLGGAPFTAVHQMRVDPEGHLWIVDDTVLLFDDVALVGAGAVVDSVFSDLAGAVHAAAYDPIGAKLVGGHATAGLPVWEDPLAAGPGPNPPDWSVQDTGTMRAVLVHEGRLFAAAAADPYLRVWSDAAATQAPAAPDVSVGAAVDDLASPVDLYARGSTLVMTDDSGGGRVMIWLDVAGLAMDEAPDLVVGDGMLDGPAQAILGEDDSLYVRQSSAVLVFENATTAPQLAATLDADLDSPADMVLLECAPGHPCAGNGACVHGTCVP
jgi:hypothetical protein